MNSRVFLFFIFTFIKIKSELYTLDGHINVSFTQFNDTELECKIEFILRGEK
jgi:hypothetical protein